MFRTHRKTAFAVVALALLAAQPLSAQFSLQRGPSQTRPNPSHLQIKGDPATADDAEDLLSSRLSSLPALQNQAVQKAMKGLLEDPKLREQFQNLVGKSGGKVDPRGKDFLQFENLVKQYHERNPPPFDLELQERLMKSLREKAQSGELAKRLKPAAREGEPRPPGKRGGEVPKPPPPTGGPSARPRERQNPQQMAQYANQAASWLNRMGVNTEFTRSHSWQKLVEGLNGYARSEAGGPENADSWFKRLGLDINPSRWFSSDGWSFRMQLPQPTLPDFSRMVPSFPQGGGFSMGTPTLPGAPSGGVWRGLLWLVLALMLCGAGWLLLSRRKGIVAGPDEPSGKELGPWPVRPEDVQSREDLIRAFEYLSLLQFGFEAQSWNHHQIATALSQVRHEPERTRAAQFLAGAYEQARYAPPQQALSASELAAARHDLCLLAGVAAV